MKGISHFMSQVYGSYSRLDFFCVLKKDLYRIKECTIGQITVSDHAPVMMKISFGLVNQFRYWRVNVSLLSDASIKEEIMGAISEYFSINDDPQWFGMRVRQQSEGN